MRICFVGAGALGSTIGGTLARGGTEVWLIDPFQAHVDAINARGLRMLEGDAETVVKISACTSASQVGIVADLVIVLVKSYHTRDAIRAAAPVIGPQTVVMRCKTALATKTSFRRKSVVTGSLQARPMLAAYCSDPVMFAPGSSARKPSSASSMDA
jgi:glycerol-3-phosphate dehydrogenase